MMYDPDTHHRRSVRLKGYDYSQGGAYFVTICTHNRKCLFGDIVDGGMFLRDSGVMVEEWWCKLSRKFPHTTLDAYLIMPNHLHGIVIIVGADPRVCPDEDANQHRGAHTGLSVPEGAHAGAPLPTLVQWFKTMTTNEFIRYAKKESIWPQSPKLWQRNYFEHVIRNERSLNAIRNYIEENPSQWSSDPDNPEFKRW
jgi:REP element-mobilizing transposase RayT